jgi:hypothetical protein
LKITTSSNAESAWSSTFSLALCLSGMALCTEEILSYFCHMMNMFCRYKLMVGKPVRSCWPLIGRLPRWRIGEGLPDMVGTGEIKYPGQTKTSHCCLVMYEVGPSKFRGRKP